MTVTEQNERLRAYYELRYENAKNATIALGFMISDNVYLKKDINESSNPNNTTLYTIVAWESGDKYGLRFVLHCIDLCNCSDIRVQVREIIREDQLLASANNIYSGGRVWI